MARLLLINSSRRGVPGAGSPAQWEAGRGRASATSLLPFAAVRRTGAGCRPTESSADRRGYVLLQRLPSKRLAMAVAAMKHSPVPEACRIKVRSFCCRSIATAPPLPGEKAGWSVVPNAAHSLCASTSFSLSSCSFPTFCRASPFPVESPPLTCGPVAHETQAHTSPKGFYRVSACRTNAFRTLVRAWPVWLLTATYLLRRRPPFPTYAHPSPFTRRLPRPRRGPREDSDVWQRCSGSQKAYTGAVRGGRDEEHADERYETMVLSEGAAHPPTNSPT